MPASDRNKMNAGDIAAAARGKGGTGAYNVADWRMARKPQNIQVFKDLFEAEGVSPALRDVRVPVGDRLVRLEDIIIGHYGIVDNNPTELMMEAEYMIHKARGAVRALAGPALNIGKYTTGKNVPILDIGKMSRLSGYNDLVGFLEAFAIHQAHLISGEYAITPDDLKLSIHARRNINIHAQLEGSSDATMAVSARQVEEVLRAIDFDEEASSRLAMGQKYAAVYMNPEEAAGMLGFTGDKEIEILRIASSQRTRGTKYMDATLEEMMKAGLFDAVDDRSQIEKMVHDISRKRFMNVIRDPIHGPGSAYQGILFVDDRIEAGYTVFKHWMSAINVADYDGDQLTITALLQGRDNPEAFRQGIEQLIHLKSSASHAIDEAYMLMNYTMKDYRANLAGGIMGLYMHGGETVTPELRNLLEMKTKGGARLIDLIGLKYQDDALDIIEGDRALASMGQALNTLVTGKGGRNELIDLLERGALEVGNIAQKLYPEHEATAVLHTLFGADALTKGGFRRLGLSRFIDPEEGALREVMGQNVEGLVQTFTAGKAIGQYVNVVHGNITMLRKYASDDELLSRLVQRVGAGEGTQAEKIIADIFSPEGRMLAQEQRNAVLDMILPVQHEIEHITIKALKGNDIDIGARRYMDEIMRVMTLTDYRDLGSVDVGANTTARKQLLNLFSYTGLEAPYAGMEATMIVRKFRGGMLSGGNALKAKTLALFTAFNAMSDDERGLAMRHALGQGYARPGEVENAIYNVFGNMYGYTGLPAPIPKGSRGDLAGYTSYRGINLSTILAHNEQFIDQMQEIPSIRGFTGRRLYKFAISGDMFTDDTHPLDAATHFRDATEDNVKVKKMIWEYVPAARDEFGRRKEGAKSTLRTGRHMFDPDTVRGELEKQFGSKVGDKQVTERIRYNASRMTDLEIDPGQRLGLDRRIRVKGLSKILTEANELGGEDEVLRVWSEIADELYYEHGLMIAGEAGTGVQNALVASGGARPSEVLQIHPESPGLLGVTPADVSKGYRPILHMAKDQLDAMVVEVPHIKYAAQSLYHGRYLWEDSYMQRYLMNMDAMTTGAGKLGLINWLQYQAHKETPAAFTRFRGSQVSKYNAPALVTMAIALGRGASTSGATLTPYGATLKTGEQIYSQMKFSNNEVEAAVELMRLASDLDFDMGGVAIDKAGVTIDFSKAAKSGEAWGAFERQMRTMLRNRPRKTQAEMLTPKNYTNMKWVFTPQGLRNLYSEAGATFPEKLLGGKTTPATQRAMLRGIFSKLSRVYTMLSASDENFTFNWMTINEAPVHGAKFISDITKAMVGVTPWSTFDKDVASDYMARGVSVEIGPDIKVKNFASALADTMHTRWMQAALNADKRAPALATNAAGRLDVVYGATGTSIPLNSLINRFTESHKAINDIMMDVLGEYGADELLTVEGGQNILNTIAERMDADKTLNKLSLSGQAPIDLSDIYDPVHKTWYLTSTITHMQPTGISRGSVSMAIDQLARIFGTHDAESVLNTMLGSVDYNMETRMAALKALAIRKAREVYSDNVENIVSTARSALDMADGDDLNVIYAQQILTETNIATDPYRVNKRATASLAESIGNKNVMLIADDMNQLRTAHRAVQEHTSRIVSFVGEKLDMGGAVKVASKTFSIGDTDMMGEWATQLLREAGLQNDAVSRAAAQGLPGRAAAGAVFSIVSEGGIQDTKTVLPGMREMAPTLADFAAGAARKAVPFLQSYWKPIAGITAGLMGLGLAHRVGMARREDAQPEEYVPVSQQHRRVHMTRDNDGYSREPGRARSGIRARDSGTMLIEPETDIIINREEYVDEHRLGRLLDRHLR